MKNIKIKVKITLWYTIFMTLLVILILVILLEAGSSRFLSNTTNRLKNTVLRSFREISFENNRLGFDADFVIEGLENGIYLSVYDMEGNYLHGRLPSFYNGPAYLIMDTIQEEYDFYTHWYIYDYRTDVQGYGRVWVRGIVSQTPNDQTLEILVRLVLAFLPLLVICIAVGGYYITKRVLAPLTIVTRTAQEITHGNDLSKRINLSEGKDEVHLLASSFDHMIHRLQDAFDREKQFTSDVSHELRTPTSVILAQCEYALSQDVDREEALECLNTVKLQAHKMSQLISQLLTLARSDQGKLTLNPEDVNLSELSLIITEEQQLIAREKEITIHPDIAPDLILKADETMIMRLLINLISNSIHYGKKGGNIWLTLRPGKEGIEGSVADDGIGIPSQHLENIWKRFYQVDSSRSSQKSGAGLGLPMVKWIVEAHGGTIQVESLPDRGTTFRFFLPFGSEMTD